MQGLKQRKKERVGHFCPSQQGVICWEIRMDLYSDLFFHEREINKGGFPVHIQKRYSDMTEYELREEVRMLKEKATKAEQLGMVNEYEVLTRKMAMAKAYMINIDEFQIGKTYELVEEQGARFTITYFNGVFAWGYREGSKEEIGIPISLLKQPEKE
ncbi:YfhH family protein [Microbacteriaceae bacterium 4G12]